MYKPKLEGIQVEAILSSVNTGNSRLKSLNLQENRIGFGLDAILLASAVNRLEEVFL